MGWTYCAEIKLRMIDVQKNNVIETLICETYDLLTLMALSPTSIEADFCNQARVGKRLTRSIRPREMSSLVTFLNCAFTSAFTSDCAR